MHESGSGTSPTLSLQRACGVCGVYGLETLYASHAASVGSKDVQMGAGALMEYIKWGLVERDGGTSSKIDPGLEVAGTEALLGLASSTFHKADAHEKALIKGGALAVDDRWRRVRGLYFSAWEFFGVVAWMGEQGKSPPMEEGLGERRRYAMWRSTEIWKAQKNAREVDVRDIDTSTDTHTESKGRQSSPSAGSSSPPSREELRLVRSYKVGDNVWYSQALRGCSRVKAVVVRVGWDDIANGPVYDVAEDKSAVVRRNVPPEACAPMLEVGDCVVFGDEDGFDAALIESIYSSHWPPRYMILVDGGLMEVEDEYLYFDDEGAEVVLSSSSEDESDTVVVDVVAAAQRTAEEEEREEVPQPEARDGEPAEEPAEEPAKEPAKEPASDSGEKKEQNEVAKESEKSTDATVKGRQRTEAKPPPPAAPTTATPVATPATLAIPPSSQWNDDVVSMTRAEKLCKSAVSCISFGDVPSAVRFLHEAIDTLTRSNA